MAVGVKVCMFFIPHRPDCHKASNSPDAGMLKKLVRDRNCGPVLRGILESLLHYLTQVLPKWTTDDKPTEKPGSEAAIQSGMRRPGQRIVVSKEQTQLRLEPTIVHFTQKDGLSGKLTGDCIPRRLTTFQLLQSKFTRSTPKPPITHQREVGILTCSRGVADLKRGQCSEPSVCKSQVRREHGPKKAATVKDIIARFAMAEQKETRECPVKKKPIQPRLITRGTVLSSLMEKFEGMIAVCKGSDFSSYESPSQEVKVTNKGKQRVDNHKRQQSDQTVGKQETHKQVKGDTEEMWIKRNASTKRQKERPRLARETSTKINTNCKENMIKAEKIGQVTENKPNQKTDSQCSLQPMKIQSFEKEIKRWTPETGIMSNLNYEHEELFTLESVLENLLPLPCRAVIQLEGQIDVHVGTIMPCFPLWSKCVYFLPKLHSEETSEGMCKEHDDSVPSKPQTAGTTEVENIKLTKNETIPRRLPKFLIPRVQRFGPQTDSLHQSESNFGDVNPSATVRQLYADESVTALNTGKVEHPPSCMTEMAFQTIAKDMTELTEQDKEGAAKEQQCIISNFTDIPQSFKFSEGMEDKVMFEEQNTSDVSSPKISPDRHIQRWRPKYTTVNYGDPSVKQTYKPKTIRFTDTFTF